MSAEPEMALEHMTLDEDFFRMTYPRELSQASIKDLEDYIELFLRRMKSRIQRKAAP